MLAIVRTTFAGHDQDRFLPRQQTLNLTVMPAWFLARTSPAVRSEVRMSWLAVDVAFSLPSVDTFRPASSVGS